MKKIIVFLTLSLLFNIIVFAKNYDEYRYKNIVVTLNAKGNIFTVKGFLYEIKKAKEKVFFERENSHTQINSKDSYNMFSTSKNIIKTNTSSYGFSEGEKSIDTNKFLTREVDKQYLIIRHKKSEYMVDVDDIICIEIKKW